MFNCFSVMILQGHKPGFVIFVFWSVLIVSGLAGVYSSTN